MTTSTRQFFNKGGKLVLFIEFDKNTKIEKSLQKVKWDLKETLANLFQKYLSENDITINDNYFLYLKRQDTIRKLAKDAKLYDLNLRNRDKIFVSYDSLLLSEKLKKKFIDLDITYFNEQNKNKVVEYNKEINEKLSTENTLIEEKYIKMKSKKKLLIFGSIFLIILLIGIVLLIFLKKRKKPPEKPPEQGQEIKKEKLVVNKKYPLNLLLRYNTNKKVDIQFESEESKSEAIREEMDFFFIVRENEKEIDKQNLVEKEKFIGYIALLKANLINETGELLSVYDKKLNNFIDNDTLNEHKIIEINQALNKTIGENGNYCFAKVYFYLNGEILDYYIPENLESNCAFNYIKEAAKYMIPKISKDLYVSNIEEELIKIQQKNDKSSNKDEKLNRRRLKKRKYKSYKVPYEPNYNEINKLNRRLEMENSQKQYINYTGTIDVEEYIVEPELESENIDLREANEGQSDDNTNSTTNLTQHLICNVENEEIQMKGSKTESIINSIIDKNGLLESVEEKTIVIMQTDTSENDNQDNKEFGNNNLLSNISGLYVINLMTINRSDYFENEIINKKIYDYFDNFTFHLYSKNNNESEYEYESENTTRDLEEEVTYYGLKKTVQKSL